MRVKALAILVSLVSLTWLTPAEASHWDRIHWDNQGGTKQLYIVDATCDAFMREPILYAARALNEWQDFVQIDLIDPGGCVPPGGYCPPDGIHIWVCPNGWGQGTYAVVPRDMENHIDWASIRYDAEIRAWGNDILMKNVMLHELGHAIGWGHNTDEYQSVMHPNTIGHDGMIITRHDLDVLSWAYCHGWIGCWPGTR